jgi:N-acetylmuramoyl-L-alanine amidase
VARETNRFARGSAVDRREVFRLAGLMGMGAFSLTMPLRAVAAERVKAQHAAKRRPVVVLDPGHGGVDPGCIGFSGIFEKHITYSAASLVARRLIEGERYDVFLTRARDEYIPLHARVERARAARADLFISIHADAIPDRSVRGASVFTVSDTASDAMAAALADRENRADLIGGTEFSDQPAEISDILFDLARRQTNNLSNALAQELVSKLGSNVRLMGHSHRSAGFAVLKAPDIPSALVEMGCLSNPMEDRLLQTASYRDKIARGIISSIDAYFTQIVRV